MKWLHRLLFIILSIGMASSMTTASAQGLSGGAADSDIHYDTLTTRSYESLYHGMLLREKTAKEEIAQEQARIESLKAAVAQTEQSILAVIQEQYRLLGITQQEVAAAEQEVAELTAITDQLFYADAPLSPDRQQELQKVRSRVAALSRKPVSRLSVIRIPLESLKQKLEQILTRMKQVAAVPQSREDQYRVQYIPGDAESLSRIAEKPAIYGDRMQWRRIYEANKALIDESYRRHITRSKQIRYKKAEDLIFPDQILVIPR